MATTITARNASQVQNKITVDGQTSTAGSTPQVVYTCPVGKKAEVLECFCRRNSYAGGMNTADEFRIRIKGTDRGFDTVGGSAADTIDALIMRRQEACIGVLLEAGDTIDFEGEDGTSNNGAMKFDITILELPA